MTNPPKRPSRRSPTFEQAIEVHRLLAQGLYQHEIASMFGWNQGRVSDVKNEITHFGSKTAAFG